MSVYPMTAISGCYMIDLTPDDSNFVPEEEGMDVLAPKYCRLHTAEHLSPPQLSNLADR